MYKLYIAILFFFIQTISAQQPPAIRFPDLVER